MAHFYGTLEGASKSAATRCGTKASGITTHAAGWHGAIRVEIHYNESLDCDMFEVSLVPWEGSRGKQRMLAVGVLDSAD